VKREIYRNKGEITKNETGNFFCGPCKGEHWNKNKNYGILKG
jgi:hypothetical protein